MASVAVMPLKIREPLGADSAGTHLSPREFDRADFEEGWRYELIDGVLVVSPIPSQQERSPNDELGFILRLYRESHPQGSHLNETLPEETVVTKRNRRRADRVIWAGLGRKPKRGETPTVIAEFVSRGKRNQHRDYEEKRDEFMAIKSANTGSSIASNGSSPCSRNKPAASANESSRRMRFIPHRFCPALNCLSPDCWPLLTRGKNPDAGTEGVQPESLPQQMRRWGTFGLPSEWNERLSESRR